MSDPSSSAPAEAAPVKKAPAGPAEPVLYNPKKGSKLSFKDKEVTDYVKTATKKNVWYYRDRMSTPRGPCTLPVLREAWVHGVIDENTLVWGQGLADFLPVKNVRTLVPQIRTLEVQAATWVKKTFGLKPALASMRKQRAEQRGFETSQVERMR